MEKIRKFLLPVSSAIVLIGAILYMYKNQDYNFLFLIFFIFEGLMLLAIELITKISRKPMMKIILLMIPFLLVLFAIQGIITNTYPFSSMLITASMYFLISDKHMLSPKKS